MRVTMRSHERGADALVSERVSGADSMHCQLSQLSSIEHRYTPHVWLTPLRNFLLVIPITMPR